VFQRVTTNGSLQSRTTNSDNQLTVIGSNTLTYDSNGDLTTEDSGHKLAYDAWNRLKSVKISGNFLIKSYTYDGVGRRITEYDGTNTTHDYFAANLLRSPYIANICIKLLGFAILVTLLGSGCTQTRTLAKQADLSDECRAARLKFNHASTEELKLQVVKDWCGVINLRDTPEHAFDIFDNPKTETKSRVIFCKIPGVSDWWLVINDGRIGVTNRGAALYFG
jgi:hypothetical protein